MIAFDEEIVLYFQKKTGIQISDFLLNSSVFFAEDYPIIVDFYRGKISEISSSIFDRINSLIDDYINISAGITQNKTLTSLLDFEIIHNLSLYYTELLVARKMNKFLRSNILNPNYSTKFEFDAVLKGESLNEFQFGLKSTDYNNDWVETALLNDLHEIEYTHEGGNVLVVLAQQNAQITNINSVVDVISGESILGKDLKKRLTIEEDDFVVLGYTDTFKQSVETLLLLEKRDIPHALELGRSELVGNNLKVFGLNPVIRQLSKLFATDDSISRFVIKKVSFEGTDLDIRLDVYSRLEIKSQEVLTI